MKEQQSRASRPRLFQRLHPLFKKRQPDGDLLGCEIGAGDILTAAQRFGLDLCHLGLDALEHFDGLLKALIDLRIERAQLVQNQ